MLEVSTRTLRPRRFLRTEDDVRRPLVRSITIEDSTGTRVFERSVGTRRPDQPRIIIPDRIARLDGSHTRPRIERLAKYGGVDVARVKVAGGGPCNADWIDEARRKALRCMPKGVVNQYTQACAKEGVDPNDPDACAQALRWITTGQENTALIAIGAFLLTITLDAALKPEMIAVNDTPSENIIVTSIQYGTVNMGIGGSISGAMFSTLSELGGYRISGSNWLYPGQKVKIGGTAIAQIAASTLVGMVSGFTDAPG